MSEDNFSVLGNVGKKCDGEKRIQDAAVNRIPRVASNLYFQLTQATRRQNAIAASW
jgi:hypothetical protein